LFIIVYAYGECYLVFPRFVHIADIDYLLFNPQNIKSN